MPGFARGWSNHWRKGFFGKTLRLLCLQSGDMGGIRSEVHGDGGHEAQPWPVFGMATVPRTPTPCICPARHLGGQIAI